MASRIVFPCGRTDPADGRITAAGELHALELDKLMTQSRVTGRRAEQKTHERPTCLLISHNDPLSAALRAAARIR